MGFQFQDELKSVLDVRVQPRASRSKIEFTVPGEPVKVWVQAPPVDDAANKAVIEFLAKSLDIPKRTITLTRGHKSRLKSFTIIGLSQDELFARLSDSANQ